MSSVLVLICFLRTEVSHPVLLGNEYDKSKFEKKLFAAPHVGSFLTGCGDGSGFEDQLSYGYDTPYEIDTPINERAVQGGFSRIINGTHKHWFTGNYSPFLANLWSLQESARKPVWAVKLSDLNK